MQVNKTAHGRGLSVWTDGARNSISGLALVAAGVLAATQAQAQSNWLGTSGTDWFNASNWTPASVPSAPGTATISNANPAIIGANASGSVFLTAPSGDTARLTVQGGGQLTAGTVVAGATVLSPTPGTVTNGELIITGANSLVLNDTFDLAEGSGTGTLQILNGGRLQTTRNFNIGDISVSAFRSGSGTVVVNGAGSSLSYQSLLLHSGTSNIRIENGGRLQNDGLPGSFGVRAVLGNEGTHVLTVTGANSTWRHIPDSLNLADPATIYVGQLNILTTAGAHVESTLRIADQGLVHSDRDIVLGDRAALAPATASLTSRLVIGALAGDAPVAAGRLQAAALRFGTEGGQLIFNHTGTAGGGAAVFDTPMSGGGTVRQLAGPTTLSGDNSLFTGTVDVSGGSLTVTSQLGAAGSPNAVAVNVTGGTLAGPGAFGGSVTIGANGTLQAHQAQPTTISGNLTMGGTFDVALGNPSTTAIVNVGGTATLGGMVNLTEVAGQLPGSVCGTGPTGRYTLVSAAGGVAGQFLGTTANFAYLSPTLSYDAGNAYLTLTGNAAGGTAIDFSSVGGGRNQRAAARGVQQLDCSNPIYSAIALLDASQARDAFSQVSGEIHASAKTALIEDGRFVRGAALSRMRSSFGGTADARMTVMSYGPGGFTNAPVDSELLAVWGQGFGAWGRTSHDGNAASLSRATGGLLAGGDMLVMNGWRIGLLGGYSHSSFDIGARRSSGSSDNYHLGGYAGTQWGPLGLRSGGTYTWHDVATHRTVAFGGFADSLSASYRAGTTQVFGEFGYRWNVAAYALEPFLNAAHLRLATDAFTERGGAAALVSAKSTTATTFTTLGLRASTELLFGGMLATARGSLAWRHALGDAVPLATVGFAGTSPFVIAGAPIAKDAAVLDAGIDLAIARNATFGMSYGGQYGSGAYDHSVRGTAMVRF